MVERPILECCLDFMLNVRRDTILIPLVLYLVSKKKEEDSHEKRGDEYEAES